MFISTMKYLLCVSIFSLLVACSNGGASTDTTPTIPSQPAVEVVTTFPPFTENRADFINPQEGTIAAPLLIAPFTYRCVYLPYTDWQSWMCNYDYFQNVYPKSNWFSNSKSNYYTWRVVMNNEFIQQPFVGCMTGPPNQSLGPNDHPYSFAYSPAFLQLGIEHVDKNDNCGRIPYMSASYVRGVQGDPVQRIFGWRELTNKSVKISFDLTETDVGGLSWFHTILHFRNPNNLERYMVRQNYTTPLGQDAVVGGIVNWNWPWYSSFQYPGAHISYLPALHTNSLKSGNSQSITLDIVKQALIFNPEFVSIEPDLLGLEISIEVAGGPQKTVLKITKVEFVQN